MIDPTPFVKHLGPRVAHVTAASNLSSIREHGLWSAHELAQATQTQDIALRRDRLSLNRNGIQATLNHQRPILHGLNAANRMLDGHTPESWAQSLDQRIFFWPEKRGQAFAKSIANDTPIAILWFKTDLIIAEFGDALYLSPINSGNFKQGGANVRRGDWIYTALTDGLEAFRTNRMTRGLKPTPDTVTEISLTRRISASTLNKLLAAVDRP